jgi:tetratricopeptide (TPR) repeat protein
MSMPPVEESIEELFRRAFALHQANKPQLAQPLYEQVLARDPRHAHSMHSLGLIAATGARRQEAIQWFRRALEHNRNEAVFYHSLALTLQADGRSAEAVKTLQMATAVNPEFVGAWQSLAEIHHALGDSHHAAQASQKVVELRTKTAETHNKRGVALTRQSKLKEAVEAFRAGIACNPRGAGLYFNAGNVLTALGEYPDAIACLNQAWMLEPKAIQVLVALSNACYRSGDFKAALQFRTDTRHLDPQVPDSQFEVSTSPSVAPPPAPGRAAEEAASTTIPQAIQQAIERHGAGDLPAAHALYTQVLAQDAENADALHLFGVLLHQQGSHRSALDLIDRAIRKNSLGAILHSNRALVLMALGELQQAEESCQRA